MKCEKCGEDRWRSEGMIVDETKEHNGEEALRCEMCGHFQYRKQKEDEI